MAIGDLPASDRIHLLSSVSRRALQKKIADWCWGGGRVELEGRASLASLGCWPGYSLAPASWFEEGGAAAGEVGSQEGTSEEGGVKRRSREERKGERIRNLPRLSAGEIPEEVLDALVGKFQEEFRESGEIPESGVGDSFSYGSDEFVRFYWYRNPDAALGPEAEAVRAQINARKQRGGGDTGRGDLTLSGAGGIPVRVEWINIPVGVEFGKSLDDIPTSAKLNKNFAQKLLTLTNAYAAKSKACDDKSPIAIKDLPSVGYTFDSSGEFGLVLYHPDGGGGGATCPPLSARGVMAHTLLEGVNENISIEKNLRLLHRIWAGGALLAQVRSSSSLFIPYDALPSSRYRVRYEGLAELLGLPIEAERGDLPGRVVAAKGGENEDHGGGGGGEGGKNGDTGVVGSLLIQIVLGADTEQRLQEAIVGDDCGINSKEIWEQVRSVDEIWKCEGDVRCPESHLDRR